MGIGEVIASSGTFGIAVLSLVVTALFTWIHAKMTDQEHLKSLKQRQKELQKKLKKERNPDILKEINEEALKISLQLMRSSFRPMFVIIIPIMILFAFMNANVAYQPITAGEKFNLTAFFKDSVNGKNATISVSEGIEVIGPTEKTVTKGKANWVLRGKKNGNFLVTVSAEGEKFVKEVIIDNVEYSSVQESCGEPRSGLSKFFCSFNKPNDLIKSVSLDNKKRIYLNLFGWKLGWLGSYIIFSIVFGMIIRRIFNIQ